MLASSRMAVCRRPQVSKNRSVPVFAGASDRPGIDGERDQPEDDRDHFRRCDGITGGAGFGTADSAGKGAERIDLSHFFADRENRSVLVFHVPFLLI